MPDFLKRTNSIIKHSSLAHSIINLVIIEGINHLLPFMALPFLYRVLGAENYGIVASAYSFFIFINIVIDFGYNLSATRDVSLNRDDHQKLNQIVSDTISSRLLIFIVAIILSVVIVENSKFAENRWVFYLMIGIPLGNCFFPIWFFQGLEKMAYMTTTTTLAKFLSFLPMFIVVRSEKDILWVSVFYSLGFIFSGLVSVFILKTKFHINVTISKIRNICQSLKTSAPYFLSRVSASLYGVVNTVVLGLVCGPLLVGYYDSAHKIIMAYASALAPITTALYPYMIKNRNIKVFTKLMLFMGGIGLLFSVTIFIFTPFFLNMLFGEASEITVVVLRIMLFYTVFKAPSSLMGYPLLAALGHTKFTNYTIVFAGCFYILATSIAYFGGFFNIYLAAIFYVMCEFIVFLLRIYGVIKYKSFKTI